MLISEFIEAIRADFQNVAELAGPENAAMIERLGATLAPAFQKHLIEALNAVVAEFNVNDTSPLSVQFSGEEIHLVRLVAESETDAAPSPSDYSARIALRLSDELKDSIEHLATDVGSSMNSWIVRTLERSVRSDGPVSSHSTKRQLRGRGRA